eukprot:TRINITY_DN1018_c0_g1_i1.p1 TRINITY_DN1018_c0_g1~~TRINITY_DN1018_c0_g1_i1.p1  ORF type:complete len:418 (+),score=68.64 TRINITY_DN1018_c0_g1_i1:136-1389(+)
MFYHCPTTQSNATPAKKEVVELTSISNASNTVAQTRSASNPSTSLLTFGEVISVAAFGILGTYFRQATAIFLEWADRGEHSISLALSFDFVLANILGSALMGFFVSFKAPLCARLAWLYKGMSVGLCGCLTSFSSWQQFSSLTVVRGEWSSFFFIQMIGLSVSLVSYRFGQHIGDASDRSEKNGLRGIWIALIFSLIFIVTVNGAIDFPKEERGGGMALAFSPAGCLLRLILCTFVNPFFVKKIAPPTLVAQPRNSRTPTPEEITRVSSSPTQTVERPMPCSSPVVSSAPACSSPVSLDSSPPPLPAASASSSPQSTTTCCTGLFNCFSSFSFPFGTFLANVIACVVSASFNSAYPADHSKRWISTAVSCGFSGSLSTISTFVSELHDLLITSGYFYGMASIIVSQLAVLPINLLEP